MPDERGACVCGNREACESVHRSELHLLKRYVAWVRAILSYMDWHPIKHASRHFISNGLSPPLFPGHPLSLSLLRFVFHIPLSHYDGVRLEQAEWE